MCIIKHYLCYSLTRLIWLKKIVGHSWCNELWWWLIEGFLMICELSELFCYLDFSNGVWLWIKWTEIWKVAVRTIAVRVSREKKRTVTKRWVKKKRGIKHSRSVWSLGSFGYLSCLATLSQICSLCPWNTGGTSREARPDSLQSSLQLLRRFRPQGS